MAAKDIQKYQELDPELAAFFKTADEGSQAHDPIVETNPRSQPPVDAIDDPLLTLKAMAEARQATARKNTAPGFDTVENDLSNVLSVGWDFITRP